jgi:hypothetical protein
MSAEIIRKTATLAVGSEGMGTADVCWTDGRVDRDGDAYAPGWAADAKVPGGRAHDLVTGGTAPPSFVADIRGRGSKYTAELSFLDTPRGREERETIKALRAHGVDQPVSMAFTGVETGSIPDRLKGFGVRRYITRGTLIELSLVTVPAVHSARVTSIKSQTFAPSYEMQRRQVAEILKAQSPKVVTRADVRRIQQRLEPSLKQWELDTAEPSDEQVKRARLWADRACAFMGTTRVRIVWEVDSPETAGTFKRSDPHTIYVNPLLPLDHIPSTVLHELAHRQRHLCGLPNDEYLVEQDEAELCELLGAA